ncbi:MAG: DUF3048 domain-containing protein [Candidatus Portnoybacteria bacterium]|nr:DUF3048 domain-containing protein [Candidatus Portnoybacteria bacterium]
MEKKINRKINQSRKSRKNKFWFVSVRARNFCKENSIIFIGLVLFVGLLFLVQEKRTIDVGPSSNLTARVLNVDSSDLPGANLSPISGMPCADYNRRPIAVMLANDPVTRPLSGLKDADLVFEMQVVQNSITRLMAIYVCGNPAEIGSIRSARHSFIPLTMGIDALYAHWGGSHFALDKLNAGVMNNIDALRNPFNAFYRKSDIPAPHNGFSSINRLLNSADKLGYRLKNEFEGYPHIKNPKSEIRNPKQGTLKINYNYPYNVEYRYDPEKNSYLRWRGGTPETDKINGQQIEAKNVVVIRTASEKLDDQYNNVEVEGGGEATIYRNGETIDGVWRKDKKDRKSKLYFFDEQGNEIEFVPGQIWVEIIEPGKSVVWSTE